MNYIVIKSKVIEEAKQKWGSSTVDVVFTLLQNGNPDSVIESLKRRGDDPALGCLLFLLQEKYGGSETFF